MNHENQSQEPRNGRKQLDDMMNTDGDVVVIDKWSSMEQVKCGRKRKKTWLVVRDDRVLGL